MADNDGKGSFDFDRLQLKSPCKEFEDFIENQVRIAERLGNREQVNLYLDALQLGKQFLSKKIGGLHDS